MAYYVGVDLGTTFTAAAVWRDGRVEISGLGVRAPVVPSVVLPRGDGTALVGEAAERRGLAEPERVAREFKRRIGDPTPLILGGAPYPAAALTARLVGWVVERVGEAEGGPPDGVVVCHPANWGDFKKDVLDQAIARANLADVATTVTEPEAAAIHYASQQRVAPGSIVAVYDLGGGTFDAAVLRSTGPGWEIVGEPQGVEHLGGVDIDEAVFRHVAYAVDGRLDALEPDDPASMAAVARLRRDCVEAKEALSSDSDVVIPVLLPGLQSEVRLTRAELEEMVRPSVVESVAALRRALRSADVAPEDVHSVLLVGGTSRMPLVAELVGSSLGRPVAVDAHPKHGTALGAAMLAAQRGAGSGVGAETHEVRQTDERPPIPRPQAIPQPTPPAPPAVPDPAPIPTPDTPPAAAPPPTPSATAPALTSDAPPAVAPPAPPGTAAAAAGAIAPGADSGEHTASAAVTAPPERDSRGITPRGGDGGEDGRDSIGLVSPGGRRRLPARPLIGAGIAVVLVAGAVLWQGRDGGDGREPGGSESLSEDPCAEGEGRTVTELDDVTIPAVDVSEQRVDDVELGDETIPGFTVPAVQVPERVVDAGCIIEYDAPQGCLGAVEITPVEIPDVAVDGFEIPAAPGDNGGFAGQTVQGGQAEGDSAPGARVEEVCPEGSTTTVYRDSVHRDAAYREAVYRDSGYRDRLCVGDDCTESVSVPALSIPAVSVAAVSVDSASLP